VAVAKINLYSESLGTVQDVNVILPKPEHIRHSAVLYLLHGLLDGHETWLQRTRLLDYAERYKLVVVMPNAQRSFYTDQASGYAWRTWIESELPQIIEQWLAVGDKVPRHIAGLSMGGYGAMKLGLSQPSRFISVASFSGVLDLAGIAPYAELNGVLNDLELSFGELAAIPQSKDDLLTLLDQPTLPYLYVSCGLQDSLLMGNRTFHEALKQRHKKFDYLEMPGDHSWSLWDVNIEAYLSKLESLALLNSIEG